MEGCGGFLEDFGEFEGVDGFAEVGEGVGVLGGVAEQVVEPGGFEGEADA